MLCENGMPANEILGALHIFGVAKIALEGGGGGGQIGPNSTDAGEHGGDVPQGSGDLEI